MDSTPIYSQPYLDLRVEQAIAEECARLADLIEGMAEANHAAHMAWIPEAYPKHRKGEPYEAFKRRYHTFREEDVERTTRTDTLFDAALALRQESL